jgi:regulator of protease activity HflC (stomatin/prohibitin superfamily)
VGWVIFVLVVLAIVAFVAYVLFDDARVRIGSGRLGQVLVRGKATDRSLLPGMHIVPTFRRMMVVDYPSLELSYRAGEADSGDPGARDLERSGPPVYVVLGDRNPARVAITVRAKIDPAHLKLVHERFGAFGLWSALRDATERSVRVVLAGASVRAEDFHGLGLVTVEERVRAGLDAELEQMGFLLVSCTLGHVDLGRAGEAIEAAARARFELEREKADAALRTLKAKADAKLIAANPALADAPLRYREIEAWRDVLAAVDRGEAFVPSTPPSTQLAAPSLPRLIDDLDGLDVDDE